MRDARSQRQEQRVEPPAGDTDATLTAPSAAGAAGPAVQLGQTVSHYRILKRLGGGGMGEVFEAEDLRLGRKVALKFLKPWIAADPDLRSRFQREARAASALDHPNICAIHDIDETADGQLFIVMAFYSGETLDLKIARGSLAVDDAVAVTVQVARALVKASEMGIVHRDVKPANIMVTPEGVVKILDFGIARLAGRGELTEPGGVVGTAAYMSPEQALGEATDGRTDIWSLGVVLYEMLTGRKPFQGGGGPAAVAAIVNQTPQPPSDLRPSIGPDLERILSRALAKSRAERYPHMADLLRDLTSFRGPGPVEPSASVSPLPSIGGDERSEDDRGPVFVARDRELALLDRFLAAALAGRGTVAFVTGEAGSGKTALMNGFARLAQAAEVDLVVAGGSCNAHTSIGDPYLPFREVLSLLTGDVEARWAARAMNREQAGRLWHLLPESARALVVAGQGLIDTFVPGAALLERAEARASGRPDWLVELSRVVARRAAIEAARLTQSDLFEQYGRVLRRLARARPLVLLFDDLQWADAGSVSLLFHLGKRIGASRILIVGAYRPSEVALGRGGERHPLTSVLNELQRDHGELRVDLGKTEGRRFVEAFLDTEPNRLGSRFRDAFYRQTRGLALYTVELVREMQESGALIHDAEGRWVEGPSLDWTAVPARVEAVVGERLARLPKDAAELLTLASVEGEAFTAEAVAHVLGIDGFEAVRRLSGVLDRRHHLVQPRGIRRLGDQRLSLFRFRHNLFQKTLYGRLTEAERAYLHEKVGTVLEALYGERAAEISIQLARHFEQAGLAEKAIDYLRQAGETAGRQSANDEAIAHLTKALELLEALPPSPERELRELGFRTTLGPLLMAARGWVAPETEATYARARELCRRTGRDAQLFPVLWGLWQFHNVAGELEKARGMAEELLDLARRLEDPALLPAAHRALGETAFWLGDLEGARAHCEQGCGLYDPGKHRSHGYLYGLDSGVICRGFWSWTLWCLGYPDQALDKARQTEALARDLAHPFSLGLARYYVAGCHLWRGEVAAAREWAASTLALADEEGFAMLRHMGSHVHGWALVKDGEAEDGVAELRRVLEGWEGGLAWSLFAATLAESLLEAGDAEGALEAVADGLATSERTEDRVWLAELHRLRGEALARRGADAGEAETCFRRAVDVARRQDAKSLELRAAASLARLLEDSRRSGEGRRILAAVYGAFTEGHGTRDLTAAKKLLDASLD